MDRRLPVELDTIKLPGKNRRASRSTAKRFLDLPQQKHIRQREDSTPDFIKMKNFCSGKDFVWRLEKASYRQRRGVCRLRVPRRIRAEATPRSLHCQSKRVRARVEGVGGCRGSVEGERGSAPEAGTAWGGRGSPSEWQAHGGEHTRCGGRGRAAGGRGRGAASLDEPSRVSYETNVGLSPGGLRAVFTQTCAHGCLRRRCSRSPEPGSTPERMSFHGGGRLSRPQPFNPRRRPRTQSGLRLVRQLAGSSENRPGRGDPCPRLTVRAAQFPAILEVGRSPGRATEWSPGVWRAGLPWVSGVVTWSLTCARTAWDQRHARV